MYFVEELFGNEGDYKNEKFFLKIIWNSYYVRIKSKLYRYQIIITVPKLE
jgi:hypothetical protein